MRVVRDHRIDTPSDALSESTPYLSSKRHRTYLHHLSRLIDRPNIDLLSRGLALFPESAGKLIRARSEDRPSKITFPPQMSAVP